MVQNPERRTALVDAAIDVLARDGARGLTFRAVDAEAAVPGGTASNYFPNRNELLGQVADRLYVRLGPKPDEPAVSGRMERSRQGLTDQLTIMYRRLADQRTDYLVLLELRLEATRRPEIRDVLTKTIRSNLQRDIAFHLASGLPGDQTSVVLFYLALSWLIVENMTLPGVLADFPAEDLIATLTELIVGS